VDLGLVDLEAEEWRSYIGMLCSNFIRLSEEYEDKLCWLKNPSVREFMTKLGYNT
jgi:hypothetical protein